MKPFHELLSTVVRAVCDVYTAPRTIWTGFIVGTLTPYLIISFALGFAHDIRYMVLAVYSGIPIVLLTILIGILLLYFIIRKTKRIRLIHALTLGFSMVVVMALFLGAWVYIEGSYADVVYFGNGRFGTSIELWPDPEGSPSNNEPTSVRLLVMFILMPPLLGLIGIFGAIAGWLAAFGFRSSVDGESLR